MSAARIAARLRERLPEGQFRVVHGADVVTVYQRKAYVWQGEAVWPRRCWQTPHGGGVAQEHLALADALADALLGAP